MDMGGDKIKRFMLLTVLIFSIALIGLGTVNATGLVTTNDTSNTTLNSSSHTISTNLSKVTKQSTPVMKGYWMFSSSAAKLNSKSSANLKKKGITDVFVCTRDVNGKYHYSELRNAITQLKKYGIKVHAWVVCFNYKGKFIDPKGYYTKKVPVYVKTTKYWGKKKVAYKVKSKKWYKHWYKHWYRSCGKWRYTWRYTWKYTWRYVTKYKYKNGWIYKPVYKYVTKKYYTTYYKKLLAGIKYINNNYAVAGIHLDYVRYSGCAEKNHAAYQQPGGVDGGVNAVTNFVKRVRSIVTKQLSAAVMPEGVNNSYYYGQNYGKLADYLNFFVPMTYQGNYGATNAWITNKIKYIVSQAKGKPVYAGLTTYGSDGNVKALSLNALQKDVESARVGGAAGFVLFRYGYGCSSVPT
ncbi:hypothetical protein [Methanobacterium sp.]|uniref:hypothetical protein n=1 Tax=Methanobacterium sp. TaxID=2164 RepID=UPI003C77EB06